MRQNGLREAYIEWIMTHGVNGKPLMDPTGCVPNLIVLVQPYVNRATSDALLKGLRAKTDGDPPAIRRRA